MSLKFCKAVALLLCTPLLSNQIAWGGKRSFSAVTKSSTEMESPPVTMENFTPDIWTKIYSFLPNDNLLRAGASTALRSVLRIAFLELHPTLPQDSREEFEDKIRVHIFFKGLNIFLQEAQLKSSGDAFLPEQKLNSRQNSESIQSALDQFANWISLVEENSIEPTWISSFLRGASCWFLREMECTRSNLQESASQLSSEAKKSALASDVLALFYINGIGVSQSLDEAKKWSQNAVNLTPASFRYLVESKEKLEYLELKKNLIPEETQLDLLFQISQNRYATWQEVFNSLKSHNNYSYNDPHRNDYEKIWQRKYVVRPRCNLLSDRLAQKPNLALGEMRSIFIGYWNSYEHHKALIASEQIMRNPNHMAKDTRKHIDVLKFVGNLKLAAEVSYQLFKSPQHTLEDEHNAANLNFKVGSYDRAIEIRESILRNPSHVEPTDELMLALTYLKHGDPAKALALAKRYTPSTIRLIKSQNTNQVTQELFDDLLHLMTLDT